MSAESQILGQEVEEATSGSFEKLHMNISATARQNQQNAGFIHRENFYFLKVGEFHIVSGKGGGEWNFVKMSGNFTFQSWSERKEEIFFVVFFSK